MQFRDLRKQYQILKQDIDKEIQCVLTDGNYISGYQVEELEKQLAEYVGTKYCISCGNGTDALSLALMVWNVGAGDAVFVPDFTFFASGETPAYRGAVPIFVDVEKDTFNISPTSLEHAIIKVKEEGKLNPKVIIAVDLFGQPADYPEIKKIAEKYNLLLLEDGAQGFGGRIGKQRACSFGDISTTSFFPAKPLGCYGDGGAIFTDQDEWAQLLKSYRVHGKGKNKYDNVHIGVNSRLDTLQAAVLLVKLRAFKEYELNVVNQVAERYTQSLKEFVQIPEIKANYYSSWAQYSILLEDEEMRNSLQSYLKEKGIPTMVYYSKPMSQQTAFRGDDCIKVELPVTEQLCQQILALPLHPYMETEEQERVIDHIKEFFSCKERI
jgi:UDP-2-acetamido-2-deoxy-ribo-hexuluronate aminotransferase